MTDETQPILFDLTDNVAKITLNRPDKLNALTPELLLALPQALRRAVDEGARAVILTGAGRGFCSGAALGARGVEGSDDLGVVIDQYYNPIAKALADLPIPIVTAINGVAAGAGASIAFAGDIIVAARSSYMLLAFANIGLVPDAGATWLVAKSAGRAKVLEMALLGERMTAEAALDCGLVNRLVDDEELMPTALAIATKLAAMPTMALGMIRRQVRVALDESFEATLAAERANQSKAGFSEDFAEGVLAFREKRPPQFKGR